MPTTTDKENASLQAAREVIEQIKKKPQSCLGLPTGRTPRALYRHLIAIAREEKVDLTGVRFFGLDEYIDVRQESAFKTYLNQSIYQPLAIDQNNCFSPIMIDDYDALIKRQGGLDLTILGIGGNGHIAFNEPRTPEFSWTHCVTLDESTRTANQEFFPSLDDVPRRAVTMGIQTILESRKIILLAFSKSKIAILNRAFNGSVEEAIPASFLTKHPNLEIYTDFEFTWLK
ncbi:MAG: glucosamine-6-phosphate deaminase [Candidatus Obscuribacterales bacterium]|nr:glucosamine-6-phosphate deaminase [Cyanobacteria bacterium HKST-UBA01]MCB9468846.1 glucosamine-6-phosphate deaminase [Candidatus Obscuribacterales bacterium]